MSRGFTVPIKFGPDGCQGSFGNKICQETQTLDIIKEFNRVYESKLHEMGGIAGGDNLQPKVQLQQNWIRDLQQQNEMLVRTVEELEKEAMDRVAMLEERLENTSVTGAKVMQKYRDYNFSNNLIQTFQRLASLETDVHNLIEFINRARNDNKWNYDGLHFKTFNPSSILIHKCESTTCQAITDGSAVPEKVSTTNSHEKANNEIAVLDSQLKEMERKLMESPKTSDVEDLNFKLHLKDEELSSVKRSMLEVQSSLVAEVAEKNDEIITLRQDMSKLEEEFRQVSVQFQSKDNMSEELQNEIIRLTLKLKQLDKSKSVVIPLGEQDNAILSLRSDLNKMEKEYNEVIERCAYKDDDINALQLKQLDDEKSVGIVLAEKDDFILSLRSNLMKMETEYNEAINQCAYKDDVIKELRNELHQLKRERSVDAEADCSELRLKFKETEDENRSLKDTIFQANRELEKFDEQANEYIAERDEYKRKYKESSEAIIKMQSQFGADKQNLEKMLSSKESVLRKLSSENKMVKQEIVNTKRQSESMSQAQNETIQALQEAIREKDNNSQQIQVIPLTESKESWVSTDESVKSSDKTKSDRGTSPISEGGLLLTSDRAQSPSSNRAPSTTSDRGQSLTSDRVPSPTSDRGQSPTSDRVPTPTSDRGQSTSSNRVSSATSDQRQSLSSHRVPSPTSDHRQSPSTNGVPSSTSDRVQPPSSIGIPSSTSDHARSLVQTADNQSMTCDDIICYETDDCMNVAEPDAGHLATCPRVQQLQKLQTERDAEREMHNREVSNLKQTILEMGKGQEGTQTEFQCYMQLEERCVLYFEKIRNLNTFINYLQDTNLHLEVTIFEYIQDVAILETRLLKYQFKFKTWDESELAVQNLELKSKISSLESECDVMRRIVNEAKDLHQSFIMMQASKEELQSEAEIGGERIQELQQKLGEKASENSQYADLLNSMQNKLCWTVCQNNQLKNEISQLLEHITDYEQNYNVNDERADYCQKEIEVCKENLTDLKEKLLVMKGLLQQKIDQYGQLETEYCVQNKSLTCMKERISENKKQYENEVCGLRCTIKELQTKLTTTETTCKCLHEDYKRSQAEVQEYSRLETQLQHDFTNNLQAAQNEIATLNDYIAQLQQECRCIKTELQTKDKQMGKAKAQISHFKSSENALLQAAQEEVVALRDEFNRVLQQHDILRAKNEALSLQLSELQQAAAGYAQQSQVNEHHVQKCVCELQFLRSSKSQLEAKNDGYLKEIQYLRCAYAQLHENYTKVAKSVSILQNDVVVYKNQNNNVCGESRNVIHNVRSWLESQSVINQQITHKFNEDQLIIHNLKEKVVLLENLKCKCKSRLCGGSNAGTSNKNYSSLASLESGGNTPSCSMVDNDSYSIDNDELDETSSQCWLRKVESITEELKKSSEYWQSKMSDDFLVTKDQ